MTSDNTYSHICHRHFVFYLAYVRSTADKSADYDTVPRRAKRLLALKQHYLRSSGQGCQVGIYILVQKHHLCRLDHVGYTGS